MAWTFTHAWKFTAPPAAVFAALTEGARLHRWFAEHVEVQLAAGGAYRFWGAFTLGTPGEKDATQRVVAFTPGERLEFSWRILGVETAVAMLLTATEHGTTLELSHAVHGELPVTRQKELIDDHWRFQLGNLAAYLAGGRGIQFLDFADPRPEVRMTIVIDAPRESVFRTMLQPELVNKWFGSSKARVTPVPGGEFWVGWEYKVEGRDVIGGTTRILELVPNEKLVLDWLDWRGDATVTGQFISFTLEPLGARTQVHFVHGGFTRTADVSDFPFGWVYFLDQFKKVAESVRG